jgi:hypothetical protein
MHDNACMARIPSRALPYIKPHRAPMRVKSNTDKNAARLGSVLKRALDPSARLGTHPTHRQRSLPQDTVVTTDARDGSLERITDPQRTRLGIEGMWAASEDWPATKSPDASISYHFRTFNWIRAQTPPLEVHKSLEWTESGSLADKLRYFAHTAASMALDQAKSGDAAEAIDFPGRAKMHANASIHTYYALNAFKEALDYLEQGNNEQAWVCSLAAYQHFYAGGYVPQGSSPYLNDIERFRQTLSEVAPTITDENQGLLYEAGKYLIHQFNVAVAGWNELSNFTYIPLKHFGDKRSTFSAKYSDDIKFIKAYLAIGTPPDATKLMLTKQALKPLLKHAASPSLVRTHEVFSFFFDPLLSGMKFESTNEGIDKELDRIGELIEEDFSSESKKRALQTLAGIRLKIATGKYKSATDSLESLLRAAKKADAYNLVDIINELLDSTLPKLRGERKR